MKLINKNMKNMKHLILAIMSIALIAFNGFAQERDTLIGEINPLVTETIFHGTMTTDAGMPLLLSKEMLTIYKAELDSIFVGYEDYKITMRVEGSSAGHIVSVNGGNGVIVGGNYTFTELNVPDTFTLYNFGEFGSPSQLNILSFVLTGTKKVNTGVNKVDLIQDLKVFSYDNNIVFESDTYKSLKVNVVSINGQLVSTHAVETNGRTEINIPVTSFGYYVVQITDNQGKVLIKKITLK